MSEKKRRTTSRLKTRAGNIEELSAALEDFVSGAEGASPGAWSVWVRFCAGIGEENPEDAPFGVFCAFLYARSGTGDYYKTNTLVGCLSEISRRYRIAGRTAPHRLPENQAEWQRMWRERNAALSYPISRATPITSEHMSTLMDAVPTSSLTQKRQAAIALLALDFGWTAPVLEALTWDQVTFSDGSATVAGRLVQCDHEERETGVPWDCLVCWLRTLWIADPDRGLVGGGQVSLWFRRMLHAVPALERLPGRSRSVGFPPDCSPRQMAGIRRATLLYAAYPQGLSWVRDRAWVAMSYTAGLRMGADVRHLQRRSMERRGDRWVLTLGRTKNDPGGERGDIRVFSKAKSPRTFQAITEYMCVRDAFCTARDGTLMLASRQGAGPKAPALREPDEGLPPSTHLPFHRLCALAGLPEGLYSPYSLRRGYAWALYDAGHDELFIQQALRHSEIKVTLLYLAGRRAQTTSVKFMKAVA